MSVPKFVRFKDKELYHGSNSIFLKPICVAKTKTLMMKRILFTYLLLHIYLIVKAESLGHDAEIILNKEEYTYNMSITTSVYELKIIRKVTRKIKILSYSGLNDFSSLYIPTFRDLNFKTEVSNIEAYTLKSDGSKKKISNDDIKETTLPANVPFLKNYRGQVKTMAFEDLEIGDTIYYSYETKYTTNKLLPEFMDKLVVSVPEQNEIQEAVYIFNIKDNFLFRSAVENSDGKFSSVKNKNIITYTLILKNIKAYRSEDFTIEPDNLPCFVAEISKDYDPYNTWDEFTSDIKNTKSSSLFFGGKALNDFQEACIGESTETRKLWKVHEIMMSDLKTDPYSLNLVYKNFTKDFVSLSQFDNLLIEYNENGKKHYFQIFDIYSNIDEIKGEYQGTEALRLAYREDKSVTFTKIPILPSYSVLENYNYIVDVKKSNDIICLNYTIEVEKKNQSFIQERYGYLLSISDSLNNDYKSYIELSLKNDYEDLKMDTVIISENKEMIGYTAKFNRIITKIQPVNYITFSISDLLKDYFIQANYPKNRVYDAYFPFSGEINRTIRIQAEDPYYFIPNRYLSNSFENEFAVLKMDYKVIQPNNLELTINYKLKKDIVKKNEWLQFLNFIDVIKEALSQRIVFVK